MSFGKVRLKPGTKSQRNVWKDLSACFETREEIEVLAKEGLQEAMEELVGSRFEQRMMGIEL